MDGNSLRENFREMASGNGPLRSLMTNLQNLNKIPEAKQLNDYVTTLTNIQVGVARFSQWGTCGGEVERWVDKASTHELTRAVKKIHVIAKELKNVTAELEKIEAGAPMPQTMSGPTLGWHDLRSAAFQLISKPGETERWNACASEYVNF